MSLPTFKTPAAVVQMENIYAWIAIDSAIHADRFLDRVSLTLDMLGGHPHMGQPWRTRRRGLKGVRKFPVRDFPSYLLLCRVEPDSLNLIAVIHGSRNLPRAVKPPPP